MFLDKFDFKATAIDDEPVKLGESFDITFWSSGKVEMFKDGKSEEITKEGVARFIASLGVFYKITPEEFVEAVEHTKAVQASGRVM